MTTSNFNDLSSFEPEAILAGVPGDHPRAAAALAVGRQAFEGEPLDVNELQRIANEIYAEGFNPEAFMPDAFFAPKPEFPSTASFSDTLQPTDIVPQTPSVPVPPGVNMLVEPISGLPGGPEALNAYQLQHAPGLVAQLENWQAQTGAYSFGGLGVPQQSELNGLLGTANASPATRPAVGSYYFLEDSPFNTTQRSQPSSVHPPFDANLVRKDFPILGELVNGRPLIWFDNAATTQKPKVVIDRISYFYAHENSNIHRAAHELAARATDAYEDARETVRRFINAPSVDNIVFVRGTTEAINLVAKTWGKKHLGEGDEILISHLEHHANIVPWQQLCRETGAVLKVAPVDDSGQVLLDEYQRLLTAKVKLVSFTQVSNALGTVTPAAQMIQMAHRAGAKVLLDGAQSVSHMRTDVQGLDADFFVFSGHKVFGPTGIGVLYGKADELKDMPAWQGGGNMIQDVTFEKTVYHEAPAKFEAGTGNIADAVGLGAALEYVERIGIDNIARYEHELLEYATGLLCKVPGLTLIGTAKEKASVLSFVLAGYKSEEVGAALNTKGIAVRSGHHCAQPILRRFGQENTVRPSLAFYNTRAEVDVLYQALLELTSIKVPAGL